MFTRSRMAYRIFALALACLLLVGTQLARAAQVKKEQAPALSEQELHKVTEASELGSSKKRGNTQRLLVLLKDPSARVRAAAAEALGILLNGYGDPSKSVTAGGENIPEILEGFGQLTARMTITPFQVAGFHASLKQALRDPGPQVREAAVRALKKIYEGDNPNIAPKDVKEAIAPLCKDPDDNVVMACAEAAYFLHMSEAFPSLIDLLARRNPQVRHQAVLYLLLIDSKKAIAPFVRLLQDADAGVRQDASERLSDICSWKLCDASIVPPLCDALRIKETRAGAAQALAYLKELAAVDQVFSALHEEIAEDAGGFRNLTELKWKYLSEFLGPQKAIEVSSLYLKYGPVEARTNAAWALGQLHDTRAVPFLCESLKDQHVPVVVRSIEALARIGDPAALPSLLGVATHSDWQVGMALAYNLALYKDPEIFEVSSVFFRNQAFKNSDRSVLIHELCALGDPRAEAPLGALQERVANDPNYLLYFHELKPCIEKLRAASSP